MKEDPIKEEPKVRSSITFNELATLILVDNSMHGEINIVIPDKLFTIQIVEGKVLFVLE